MMAGMTMVHPARRATASKKKQNAERRTKERAPPFPQLTPSQLRRWRLKQKDPSSGKPATLVQAARWYGCSVRAWQYWEAVPPRPHRVIPVPLVRRIVVLEETIFPSARSTVT